MEAIQLKDLYNEMGTYLNFPSPGVEFKDMMPLLNDPDKLFKLVIALAKTIPDNIDVIVGPESRGFLLGILVAYNQHLRFVPIRKQGKLPGRTISCTYDTEYSTDTLEIQKDIIKSGDNCWFIDDVYATGGTYEAAEELINKSNGFLLGGTTLLSVLGNHPDYIIELFEGVKD